MPSITATLVSSNSMVKIDIDTTDEGSPYVYVARVNEVTGVATPIRTHGTTGSNGDGLVYQSVSAGFKGTMYDTEFPRDVNFHYTLAAPAWELLLNTSFATTYEPWSTTTGSLSWGSNITALPTGVEALVVHPDGVSPTVAAKSELALATPGGVYVTSMTVLTSANCTLRPVITFYDVNQSLLVNNTMPNTSALAGVPVVLGYSATAPANTRFVQLNLQMVGTPPQTTLTYWYGLSLMNWPDGNATAVSATLNAASVAGQWRLRDPLRPVNDITMGLTMDQNLCNAGSAVVIAGINSRTYPSNNTRFNIAGSPYTQTVSRVRGALQGTLTLVTRTAADEAILLNLLSPGTPLLLQSPTAYNMPDMYLSIDSSGVAPASPDQSYSIRVFQLPFAAELAPGGPGQGVLNTRWADLCDWTWATANAGAKTWLNVMQGGL